MSAPNKDWEWISAAVIHAVHQEQLAEHGGAAGVRDDGLLQSALGRPKNLALYDTPDVAALAASYSFGIARNHPFIDGNKRTAFVAMELFLALNGYALHASDQDSVFTMLDVAAGKLDEPTFAQWIRHHLRASDS